MSNPDQNCTVGADSALTEHRLVQQGRHNQKSASAANVLNVVASPRLQPTQAKPSQSPQLPDKKLK